MKQTIRFVLGMAFIAASVPGFAQKPQPVYSIVRQIQNFEWYEEQAKAWKREIDNGTSNAMAWVYWNEANRMIVKFGSSEEKEKWENNPGDYFMSRDSILKSAEMHIPDTFEYYYLKALSESLSNTDGNMEKFKYYLFKAQEIRPYDDLLFSYLLNHYILKNDKENVKLVCKKWFESNEIPQDILITLYNMLISLEENAILLVNADNDTYPCWVLQYAKNIRPDVLVMNASFARTTTAYGKNIFKENGINPLINENDTISYVTEQELFKHLVENINDRPLYVSVYVSSNVYKEYNDKMYLTGLALKYSPKPFNNLAVLRDNVENKFLLDFLKQHFHNSYAQSVENRMNGAYLSVFYQLYNHYKQIGEKDKAQKIKELATTVARDSELTEWLDYFEKL